MFISTIPEILNRSARFFGKQPYQWYQPDPNYPSKTETLSYVDTFKKVKALSCGLMILGINPRDRVAIIANNCPQYSWIIFAVLANGSIPVIFPSSFSINEIKYVLNHSETRFIFTGKNEHKLTKSLHDISTIEKIIAISDMAKQNEDRRLISITELEKRGQKYLSDNPYIYKNFSSAITQQDTAAIIYTLGANRIPKGFTFTHFNILDTVIADSLLLTQNGIKIDENDVFLSFTPFSPKYERLRGEILTLISGGTIAYVEQMDNLMRDIQIYKPTWFFCNPGMFDRIYAAMQDAYYATPEGKAIFQIAMEIGLEIARHYSHKDFLDITDIDNLILPDELKSEYKWADLNVFSRFRTLLGEKYRFSISAGTDHMLDLNKTFMPMGIRIFTNNLWIGKS